MTLIETEPPLTEPVTLADVKAHLKIEHSDEDGLVTALIAAARRHLEAVTGLALVSQGFRLILDDWPDAGVISLRRYPVQSVEAVLVYDADGVPLTLDPATILLDGRARPARLLLRERIVPQQALNGIEIDFTAGFPSSAEVPADLVRALLMHVAMMYELRGAISPDQQPAAIPRGYDRLVAPYQRRSL